jgi:hypothetical protein
MQPMLITLAFRKRFHFSHPYFQLFHILGICNCFCRVEEEL